MEIVLLVLIKHAPIIQEYLIIQIVIIGYLHAQLIIQNQTVLIYLHNVKINPKIIVLFQFKINAIGILIVLILILIHFVLLLNH